ncbi:MAG TPA: hypothetical protein VK578_02605 [Edaphobacter sp.]|nr:hypothetical protein [Edaphobacter sp.]
MAGKSKAKPRLSGRMMPILHPDAAGIDIGAEEIFVAVGGDPTGTSTAPGKLSDNSTFFSSAKGHSPVFLEIRSNRWLASHSSLSPSGLFEWQMIASIVRLRSASFDPGQRSPCRSPPRN